MGRFSVRPFVRSSVRSSVRPPPGHPARPEAQPTRPEAKPARPEAQPSRPETWPATCETLTASQATGPMPAQGGARPEAFGICEAFISTYAYGISYKFLNWVLFFYLNKCNEG